VDQVIATIIVGLLATPIAATVAYFINRRKNKIESDTAIATGANIAVEAITSVLENIKQELDETKKELEQAVLALSDMRKQNERLIAENQRLTEQIAELKLMLEELRKG
jgi:hypothetical protein